MSRRLGQDGLPVPRGRGTLIGVRLTPELAARLEAQVARSEEQRAVVIRDLLRLALDVVESKDALRLRAEITRSHDASVTQGHRGGIHEPARDPEEIRHADTTAGTRAATLDLR